MRNMSDFAQHRQGCKSDGGTRPGKSANRLHCLLTLVCLALFLFVTPNPAHGQQYGRWTWHALVGAKGRSLDTTRQGAQISSYGDSQLDLSFTMHGYIYHPSIASFNVGGSLLYNDINGSNMGSGRNFGLNASLELTPQSSWPSRVFYARTDYSDDFGDILTPLSAVPAVNTRYGASVRNRRGFFRGLSLGFIQNETGFLDKGNIKPETRTNAHLFWNRKLGPVSNSFQLENLDFTSGPREYQYEDWTARLNQSAVFNARWSWGLNGSLFRRDYNSETQSDNRSQNFRVYNRFTRNSQDQSSLELRHTFFRTEAPGFTFGVDQRDTQNLSAYYNYAAGDSLTVAPFASYSSESSDRSQLDAPQGGFQVLWQPSRDKWSAGLSATASVGTIRGEYDQVYSRENTLTYGAHASFTHGKALHGWRKELVIDANYNDLIMLRESLPEFPDVILPINGVGGTDSLRSRITLSHAWDSRQITAYGEWSQDEFEAAESDDWRRTTRMTGSFQFSHPAFSATGQVLHFQSTPGMGMQQEATGLSANGRWNILRNLALRATYRYDMRRLPLSPDIDTDRYEVGVEYRLGQFLITARVYEFTERPEVGSQRSQTGITWSIGRRFAGPLPILTGARRRGTIR